MVELECDVLVQYPNTTLLQALALLEEGNIMDPEVAEPCFDIWQWLVGVLSAVVLLVFRAWSLDTALKCWFHVTGAAEQNRKLVCTRRTLAEQIDGLVSHVRNNINGRLAR